MGVAIVAGWQARKTPALFLFSPHKISPREVGRLRRSGARSKNPNLIIIEGKIVEVRRRWRDTTSTSEAAMCERFVNQLLERWLKISDQDKVKEIVK